jgi:hypothetical protein
MNELTSQFRRSIIEPRELVYVPLSVPLQPIAEDSVDNTAANPAETAQEYTESPDAQNT